MQRLFSSFPRGRPGVVLLLLRATVGVSLIVQGGASLAAGDHGKLWATGAPAIVIGASLLLGVLTSIASILAEIYVVGIALAWLSSPAFDVFGGAPATLFLVVMAAAVLLLGPGAYSLDARLFGRREIVIPSAVDLASRSKDDPRH